MKMKLKNLNKATPAKWSKLGNACVAASAMIAGYGLTMDDKIVGYIGLGIGVFGSFLSNLFAEEK